VLISAARQPKVLLVGGYPELLGLLLGKRVSVWEGKLELLRGAVCRDM